MGISELETYWEGNRLEVKAAQGGLPGDVWPSVSALANTGGGMIVLGVRENAKTHELFVIGLKDAHKMLDDFVNAANSRDKLSSMPFSDENLSIKKLKGREVIVIEVPRASRRARPLYVGHDPFTGTYRRTFVGDYRCDREEVASMLRDAAVESLDLEPAENYRLENLDWETIRRYRAQYDAHHEASSWSRLPDEQFLCRIGAAVQEGDAIVRPTEAGVLMFGQEWQIIREFPSFFLDYRQETGGNARWQDRFTSQDPEWSGNVFDFYERAYNRLRQALRVPFRLNGDRRIDETPAHEALREALANCLTNADFRSSRPIVCRWTEDSIELTNPGCFRVEIEQAYRGGTSDARNKTMLRMFTLIQVGERAGSGVPNMVDRWTSCGYGMPRLSESFGPEVSRVILPLSADSDNLLSDNSGKKIVRNTRGGTRENEEAIVSYLTDHGESRSQDIADEVGISRTRANQLLRGLIDGGVITAVGGSRNRRYRLAD